MKGSCLCKNVGFEITKPYKGFQYCFCSRCRKTSGSAHSANIFVPLEQFMWTRGEENIALYKLPEAKRFSSCFCRTCGSVLPWLVPNGKNYVVPAGSLDESPEAKPEQSIFFMSKAEWYVDPCHLPAHDELPAK